MDEKDLLIAELIEALKPFASFNKETEWVGHTADKHAWGFDDATLYWGDFQRAAAVLSKAQHKED